MRATIDLDDDLVARARAILDGGSLNAIIESSLREAIRTRGREKLRQALGNFELSLDEGELEAMRRDRALS
jgi:Arc/MetJ family transcription regulator